MSTVVKHKHLQCDLEKRSTSKALVNTTIAESDEDCDNGDYFGLPAPNTDFRELIDSTLIATQSRKTKADHEMDNVNRLVNSTLDKAVHQKRRFNNNRVIRIDYSDINHRAGISNESFPRGVEKCTQLPDGDIPKPSPNMSGKKRRELSKLERSKSKGVGWFNLPATELTDEVRNDLKIIQMRSALDPKHFYKKNDFKVLPKYFQIGTVQHSPLDYYTERHVRHKKSTLVDELLADERFQSFNKRKYQEVVARKEMYARRRALKKMKKLKKK